MDELNDERFEQLITESQRVKAEKREKFISILKQMKMKEKSEPQEDDFNGMNLTRTQVRQVFVNSVRRGKRPNLNGANLERVNLSGTILREASFNKANLRWANLSNTDLSDADFYGADLFGANLSGADLRGTHFKGADLTQVILSRSLYDRNTQWPIVFNIEGSNAIESLTRETVMQVVKDARERGERANFSGVDFSGADFRGGDFSGADFRGADLKGVDFSVTNLSEANFSGADLVGADFSGANINRANFRNTRMRHTVFAGVDFHTVKGLDTVNHYGPSYIDIQAIYKSNGNIPEVFLRGAGVPDTFITFMRSLTGAAIDFYSCFISYSTKDQVFAERLHADLQAKGVRCWYAPHDIQGGKKIHEQIDQAIRLHDKLLLILSEHSMASEWVKTEIYKTRQTEVEEHRRKLFPISLVEYNQVRQWEAFDADSGKDMAREVREYYIPDFTLWEHHTEYQKAFERLLYDLKADTAPLDNVV